MLTHLKQTGQEGGDRLSGVGPVRPRLSEEGVAREEVRVGEARGEPVS